ncbi:zinc finger protein RFP-like isoform X1 [Malaclemys terrapin pileata]|uniref:zinc finger protein RFP-like isoform X1 n=1 Tax=Malaclemys terrapin pileata TaxID=2991368 RepID=UPI0023A8D3BF|nr:zinc finger protein RFP-like isoform X1 [Malaclemys terrapin pileata]
MAAANPAKTLQDELTCPICLEYFKDPVSLDCDHSFCRACITQCWEGFDTDVSCPQCREIFPQRNLRLNRQLRNIVEAARELRLQTAKEPEPERLCEKHKEPLKLFCKEDEIPICLVCDRSKEHRDHTVIPAEEAAEEFKRKTLTKRQKIVSEFQQLRQFLEEQERLLLAQLEKLDEEIVKIQNENITKLSEEISCLSELISEMEGKCQKPTSEFLQDVRSTLGRCEKGKFQQPEEISPELEERISGFSQKTIALLETVRKFKDTLPSALETKRVNVTLDPDTVHPQLVLSEDWKSVRWEETWQDLPDNPERFDTEPCVLGCEGFTSGRHCWEVELGCGGGWFVGVARESVRRKGQISPEEGIWGVGYVLDQFWALTSPATPLPLSRAPSRIRVCLDCDRGQVTFIDAGDKAPIFTFPPGSVPGERIRPWLWVLGEGSRLCLCP